MTSPKLGLVRRFTYAIGFLIGVVYAVLVYPFYSPSRRLKRFIAEDQRYNG